MVPENVGGVYAGRLFNEINALALNRVRATHSRREFRLFRLILRGMMRAYYNQSSYIVATIIG